jgi:hypothetical protein
VDSFKIVVTLSVEEDTQEDQQLL